MAAKDSIIDHRNIGRLYITWVCLVIIIIALAVLAYTLQYTTPFLYKKSLLTLYIVSGVSVILAVWAILFKYIFKKEVVAWVFSTCIACAGLMIFLLYGWHWGFTSFFAVALGLLIIIGPYLYFD